MTRSRMYLRLVGKSILRRLSRVIIASLSLIVGAATVSGLTIITFTVPDQIARELRSYGANMVVMPTAAKDMNLSQVKQVNAELKAKGTEVVSYAPYRFGNALYKQQPVNMMATDLGLVKKVRPYWIVDGEFPAKKGEALIGSDLAQRYRFQAGQELQLNSPDKDSEQKPITLNITGVLHTGGKEDGVLVLSLADAEELLSGSGTVDVAEYSIVGDESKVRAVATAVDSLGLGVEAQVVKRIAQSEGGVTTTLRSLFTLVSVIVCVLTLIGVTTTMNSIVLERKTEIALKKALGASNRGILTEFLGESIALGLLAGLAGAASGIGIALFVTKEAFNRSLDVSWWILPATMVVAAIISGVGSLLPARRVSRINPAIVLGGE